jgi:hypothetical protein
MQSGIEAEAGDIEEAGDIKEDIGDEADGATEVGGTGVAGATCPDGPIDLIGGSIASMDVLTGRQVARPGPAGGGRAAPIGGGDLGISPGMGNSSTSNARPASPPGTSISALSRCRSGCQWRKWPTISSAASVAPRTATPIIRSGPGRMHVCQGVTCKYPAW